MSNGNGTETNRNERANPKRVAEKFASLEGREIVERREPNVKHFDLGGGRRQAVVYPFPVHYKDGDGYKDIDNTLTERNLSDGSVVYQNESGPMRVRLAKNPRAARLVTLESNGHSVSWGFGGVLPFPEEPEAEDAAEDARAPVVYQGDDVVRLRSYDAFRHNIRESGAVSICEQEKRARLIDRKQSEVMYPIVAPGVSALYDLEGDAIKESLRCDDYAALENLTLNLRHEGAEAVLSEDGSISIRSLADCSEWFRMDAPTATDATGASVPLHPALNALTDESVLWFTLGETVDPDEIDWPLTIDPTTHTSYEASGSTVHATYISSGAPTTNFDDRTVLYMGRDGSANLYYTLLKFDNLISLESSDTVVSAQLKVTPYSDDYRADYRYVAAYPIRRSWDETTVTYNGFKGSAAIGDPANVGDMLDCVSSTTGSFFTLDITNLYREWYTKDESGNARNFGVLLGRPFAQSSDTSGSFVIAMSTTNPGYASCPTIFVNYMSHAGVEGWGRMSPRARARRARPAWTSSTETWCSRAATW